MTMARHVAIVWPPLVVPAGKDFSPVTVHVDPRQPKNWLGFARAWAAAQEGRPLLLLATCPYSLAVAMQAKLPDGWEIVRLRPSLAAVEGGRQ